ncbi:MAG: RNA polymerase factor sigma-54 [Prevotella sp.]|nr:RNA polymerase factor sigma-54 [Candidatus Equicola faecalis]MDO4818846.1 RNA polymerase factor sigma-54 [Prevotella sp.]
MAQRQEQNLVQSQQQKTQQILSPQQVLQVRILELSATELQERINLEMADNPALEAGEDSSNDDQVEYMDSACEDTSQTDDISREEEQRREALDDVLQSILQDDEPDYTANENEDTDRGFFSFSDTTSFYEELLRQMHEYNLTEHETKLLEYLIGNLESDGYLRADIDTMCEELAIYHNIDTDEEEMARMLDVLHDFDPPGIGARNLQECLLLQIRRSQSRLSDIMRKVIEEHFEEFTLKHWGKIKKDMHLTDAVCEEVFCELTHLNPKPGAAIGDVMGRSMERITPDFIVETDDDGRVSFSINSAGMPSLMVEPAMEEMAKEKAVGTMSRSQQEAVTYARTKVAEAKSFITAVQQRRQTMYRTMKTIISLQHAFFATGDEAQLRPMILKDVAERAGLDISTVSRVNNSKFAQTRWGVYPLKFFFTTQMKNDEGEEVSTHAIKQELKDIIATENPQKPLSDDALAKMMKTKGYPVARRTIAKYREQMGIPVARLRKPGV